ncbi:hypothetical protein [Novosphingobium resinovorum]|uniref:SPOR domain-containing protein n=1 Tax=Novosphingobium resinovorum TaxID=158500 RepID=A0A1D8A380_9SPHN|nr:hypothetical protein [Novosphingobium resinovorum]AOR76526.1 hypothetical protein BES08_07050 [Novosphingobium resinovorum]
MFAIAKPAAFDRAYYVTAIRRAGLSIDNVLYDPDARGDTRWQARKWKNRATAEAALQQMRDVGGFEDYQIVPLEGR